MYYCTFDHESNSYEYFFRGKHEVRMCGIPEKDILSVNLIEDENGDYYAYKELETGDYPFIYNSLKVLHICSPDSFKSAISDGEGEIVRLSIVEIN